MPGHREASTRGRPGVWGPLRCLGALDFKFHKSLKAPTLRLTPCCEVVGASSSQREKAFLLLENN
eukprot:4974631-Pleurochrysis_carterae.AAC.1